MNTGVREPSSTIVMLLRIDRAELRSSATSIGMQVVQPKRRFSGRGLPWYALEGAAIQVRLNGILALATGVSDFEIDEDSLPPAWFELCQQWPVIAETRPQILMKIDSLTSATLEALEYYSGAVELLDNLMTFALSRPGATAREIAACERWLHGRFTQYLTGRGALRNVVLPWRTWLERYEYLLRSLEGELEQLSLPDDGPFLKLSKGLDLLNTDRDRKSIIHEYRIRLGDLTDACNRVSAEIGVIGTFGSLALVPFESTLGLLFLAPVLIAGTAYYGGHSFARAVVTRTRWRRTGIDNSHRAPIEPEARPARQYLDHVLDQATSQPVDILASPRLSAADIACALEVRLQLLERTKCQNPLSAVAVKAGGSSDNVRIIFGGPLVRASPEPFVSPECDLTDSRGNGWEIVADDKRIIHCDDDETVGCCVAGSDGKTIFVFGVRDSGTVVTTRWLAQALDNIDAVRGATWIVLRRGKDNRPEELARG
jgi:hypothetical protein